MGGGRIKYRASLIFLKEIAFTFQMPILGFSAGTSNFRTRPFAIVTLTFFTTNLLKFLYIIKADLELEYSNIGLKVQIMCTFCKII